MPHPQHPNIIGDYAVVINHKLPTKLTNEQKKKLKEFFKQILSFHFVKWKN